jgi:hypothetical protein
VQSDEIGKARSDSLFMVGLTGFEPATLDPQEVAEKAFPRSPEFVVADAHYVTFRDAQVVQHRA